MCRVRSQAEHNKSNTPDSGRFTMLIWHRERRSCCWTSLFERMWERGGFRMFSRSTRSLMKGCLCSPCPLLCLCLCLNLHSPRLQRRVAQHRKASAAASPLEMYIHLVLLDPSSHQTPLHPLPHWTLLVLSSHQLLPSHQPHHPPPPH